jgi:hypothetical protein
MIRSLLIALVACVAMCFVHRPAHAEAPAAAPAGKQFVLFVYETPEQAVLRDDKTERGAAYWQGFMAFAESMKQAGVLRGGVPLVPAELAKFASARTGTAAVAGVESRRPDGLRLGGFFMIEVADEAAALAWAAKAPNASTGGIEVWAAAPDPVKPAGK